MASLIGLNELGRSGHREEPHAQVRVLMALVVLTGALVLGRLWQLQIVRGDEHFRQVARNSFKARELPSPRGIVFDRHGNRVADVRPSFDVIIRPDLIKRPPRGHEKEPQLPGEPLDIRSISGVLSQILNLPRATVEDRYYGATGRARYKAVVIKSDVTRDEIARLEARRIELPGVDIQVSQKRTYPEGALFAHLVGYLGEVQKTELARLRDQYRDSHGEDFYEIGDYIGRYGLERQYESSLKGIDGVYYVQEDATGRVINELEGSSGGADVSDDGEYTRAMSAWLAERSRSAVAGNDLFLTVDHDLQRYVREQLEGMIGSVVVMDPSSGQILAMVNAPSVDPEIFSRRISHAEWKQLSEDPGHPLEDKALRGQYAPASTFKMIPAAAALQERLVTPDSTFFCAGSMVIGGRRFRCHKPSGHGPVNLARALQVSCDVYFYSIGPKLGAERLTRYARAFGFGAPTGLGLNFEKGGLVPTDAWKQKIYRQPWVVGDTVSGAIGQGFNLVTPVQVARYTSALANGGRLLRPYVVGRVQNYEGRLISETLPEEVGRLPISESHLRSVLSGMLAVVEREGGTAYAARIKGFPYAGKTGTAQVVRQEYHESGKKLKPRLEDHAWFTAYAPYKNPELVVTVMIEHGGHGGAVAAPLARNIIRHWFEVQGRLPKEQAEETATTAEAFTNEPVEARADASGPED